MLDKFLVLVTFTIFILSCSDSNRNNSAKLSTTSEITCPQCGHKKVEILPTEVCTFKYSCDKCKYEMTPKDGDCCVFCTYGTHKCPSMQ